MENFKIDLFLKENKEASFPDFEKLSDKKCLQIKQKAFQKLQLDELSNVIELLNLIRKKSTLIPDLNADSEIFNLQKLINILPISKPDFVNINWYRFDDIDRFKIETLSDHFKYIWYPGPDDIEIFPDDLSWIILIDATGSIFIYK
jgi:hypothetical protein